MKHVVFFIVALVMFAIGVISYRNGLPQGLMFIFTPFFLSVVVYAKQ